METVICPNKNCKKCTADFPHNVPHEKHWSCDYDPCFCPACVPYVQEPKLTLKEINYAIEQIKKEGKDPFYKESICDKCEELGYAHSPDKMERCGNCDGKEASVVLTDETTDEITDAIAKSTLGYEVTGKVWHKIDFTKEPDVWPLAKEHQKLAKIIFTEIEPMIRGLAFKEWSDTNIEAEKIIKQEAVKAVFEELEEIFVRDACHYSKVINLEDYEALKKQMLEG